ncbi:hypothetical protein JCM15765_10020 [Paradesulfitobacterium aromaticivorans]
MGTAATAAMADTMDVMVIDMMVMMGIKVMTMVMLDAVGKIARYSKKLCGQDLYATQSINELIVITCDSAIDVRVDGTIILFNNRSLLSWL